MERRGESGRDESNKGLEAHKPFPRGDRNKQTNKPQAKSEKSRGSQFFDFFRDFFSQRITHLPLFTFFSPVNILHGDFNPLPVSENGSGICYVPYGG